MINVTKTFLPPILEFNKFVENIWNNEWLTNRGQFAIELENKLREYLMVDNIICMNNGTLPIQIALKNLASYGEVITTPFSYVATTSAIIWENCTPVFADIHPEYLTIDETKIEELITKNTTCILATHVFGNICNVEKIEQIAKSHNLKVIYDAAHCFGVKYKNQSIFNYGDISTCSFHATKLFHTAEGGAIFCKDEALRHKLFYSHNFGHDGPVNFFGLGINGKISELHAAMGLSVLPYVSSIINSRKKIIEIYNSCLKFRNFRNMLLRNELEWNYSYYPIIFNNEDDLLNIQNKLNQNNIFPRRYFYPSLNKLPFVTASSKPISEKISSSILCLPLFFDLSERDQIKICQIINS